MDTISLTEVEGVRDVPTNAYWGLDPSVSGKLGGDELLLGDERSHRAVSVGPVEGETVMSYSGCFSLLAYEDFVGDVQQEVGLSLPMVKNSFTFEFLIERVVTCLEQAFSDDEEVGEWEGEYVVDAVEAELRFVVWKEV